MRRLRITGALLMSVMLAFGIASCAVQPCYEDTDPLMNTLLLTSGTGETAKADSLRVRGVMTTDTIEFVDARTTSYFSLPLVHDTAVIFYTRHPHLVSPECGYTFISRITGLKTTHNIIDTLIIDNNKVDLNGEKNLHLFY